MILDLREFETFPAHKLLIGEPVELALEADLRIQKSGEEYFCQGKVNAIVNVECSRCLNGFDLELENETDFIICSEADHAEDEKEAIDTEDYVYFSGSDIQADISEIVRQTIILSVAMKPLCSEDCKGICPQCGINLNENTCSCETEKIDPRWESLKKLSGSTTEYKEQK